jgi:hypothetical protein
MGRTFRHGLGVLRRIVAASTGHHRGILWWLLVALISAGPAMLIHAGEKGIHQTPWEYRHSK